MYYDDLSQPDNSEIRHRLREGREIVGFSRIFASKAFYSKDEHWWSGSPIPHEERDLFAGIQDKNRRFLYENDIVELRFGPERERLMQLWIRLVDDQIELIDLGTFRPVDLEDLGDDYSLEFISHSFLNEEAIFGSGVH